MPFLISKTISGISTQAHVAWFQVAGAANAPLNLYYFRQLCHMLLKTMSPSTTKSASLIHRNKLHIRHQHVGSCGLGYGGRDSEGGGAIGADYPGAAERQRAPAAAPQIIVREQPGLPGQPRLRRQPVQPRWCVEGISNLLNYILQMNLLSCLTPPPSTMACESSMRTPSRAVQRLGHIGWRIRCVHCARLLQGYQLT